MDVLKRLGDWLVFQLPAGYLRAAANLPTLVLEVLGVEVHARYLLVPMFHDTTFVGRLISFIFRVMIVLSGLFFWLLTTIAVWSIGPLLLISPILALTYHPFWSGFFMVGWGMVLGLRLVNLENSWTGLKGDFSEEKVLRALPFSLSKLAIGYPNNVGAWINNWQVREWLARLEVDARRIGDLWSVDSGVSYELLKQIFDSAKQNSVSKPGIADLMLGLWNINKDFQQLMEKFNVRKVEIEKLTKWMANNQKWWGIYHVWDEEYAVGKLAGVNRAMTGTPTPVLNRYSFDLTLNSGKLPMAVDREEATDEALKFLSNEGGKHVMIIGETGTGKTTFIGGLAQKIMMGGAPEAIANKRLVKLEPGSLLSGVGTQGELVGRMTELLDEIKRSENIILFIDEIHTLMTEQGGVEGLNLFSVLEEWLFEQEIQVIGATSVENYKKFVEPNEAFTRLFEIVKLEEPDDENALLILENMVSSMEAKYGVVMSMQALDTAIELSKRYIHDRVLPDKARVVLEEAGLEVKGVPGSAPQGGLVTAEVVAKVVTRISGVPVAKLGESEKKLLMNLEDELHKQYVDQELAVSALADAMRRGRLDVKETDRPIGVFMFVGPTGVGKTELARRLSEVYFGSEDAMVRLDMGEFGQEGMMKRLLGAPPGEAGYGEGGELTEEVRRRPSTLLLMDEVEKAHPKVWNLLTRVMDEGKLKDASGLEVDFTNVIMIATSNAATDFITERVNSGDKLEDLREQIFDELMKTFKIEFLNRFDGIIPFGALDETSMEEIVKIQLEKLVDRLKAKRLRVKYTKDLVKVLAKRGVDPKLGARPLRRLIQDKLESHLAKVLLSREGEEEVSVELEKELLAL